MHAWHNFFLRHLLNYNSKANRLDLENVFQVKMKTNLLTITSAYHRVVIKSSDSRQPFLDPFTQKTGVQMHSVIRVLDTITKDHAISELCLVLFLKVILCYDQLHNSVCKHILSFQESIFKVKIAPLNIQPGDFYSSFCG